TRFSRDWSSDVCSSDLTRLFINLGALDQFSKGEMLGYICDNSRISGKTIGKIDVKGVYSFFEVQNEVVDKIFSGFQNVDFEGRQVRIENAGAGRNEHKGDRKKRSYRPNGSADGRAGRGGFRQSKDRDTGGGFQDFSGKRKESRSKSRW